MTTNTISGMFNVFDTVRTAILKSSTISNKFKKSDIHTTIPKPKSICSSLPYIVIPVPNVDSNERYIGRNAEEFNNNILLSMTLSYDARDNFGTYFGAMFQALYDNEADINAVGYYIDNSSSTTPVPSTIGGKDVVIGTMTLIAGYDTVK